MFCKGLDLLRWLKWIFCILSLRYLFVVIIGKLEHSTDEVRFSPYESFGNVNLFQLALLKETVNSVTPIISLIKCATPHSICQKC